MSNQEAVDFVQEELMVEDDLNVICCKLAQHALDLDSLDNVSVCIVMLP